MADTPKAGWAPDVERRTHPFGSRGVNSSLDEVAKKAAEGALSFRVRKWVGDCLDRARKNGQKTNSGIARARILLKAAQDKLWIPDPVGAEWMPGAHLLACSVDDKDGPCLKGEDCDGLAILLGAACTNAGIPTLIVGHSYDKEQNISHVLCAVHVNDRWWYADPSTEYPLGEYMKFTRERILAIPSGKMVCDSRSCLTGGKNISPDVTEPTGGGTFVGVNGVATDAFSVPDEAADAASAVGASDDTHDDAADRHCVGVGTPSVHEPNFRWLSGGEWGSRVRWINR